MNEYLHFIDSKRHIPIKNGVDPTWFPDIAFDFQKAVAERAIVSGRYGVFADTGLGKTLIQSTIAANYLFATNKKVLIVTPLAVAYQFIDEAKKIGLDGMMEYRRNGVPAPAVTVINYDQLHRFNPGDFETVLLDESSILKNFNGSTKADIQNFVRKIKYRFLSSATPSPNDFTELGNSSETLGRMGYMDMLGAFFKNNQKSNDSRSRNVGEKYYLKPHAERDFFSWVNTWSVMMRRPSDLGFIDDRHVLPELVENELFISEPAGAKEYSFADIRKEQRDTERVRCTAAVMSAYPHTASVYWCNTNSESSLLACMDSEAVELLGSMRPEKKEEILIAFQRGEIKRLITKAKMTSTGLNWQHCNHTVFFPTYSYEQYYQSIRRFYRFGQTNDVTVDLVMSGGQSNMIRALREKRDKADKLYSQLVRLANTIYEETERTEIPDIQLPEFLK